METPFVIFDTATGAAKRFGRCQSTMLEAQAREGEIAVGTDQFDLEGLRPVFSSRVDERRDECIAGGFHVASGPLAGEILQTGKDSDKTNWLVSQSMYDKQVAAGNGAVVAANFRTLSNTTITISFADGASVLDAMAIWGASVMAHSWALKDEIAAAASVAELLSIDIDAGWPE